MSRRLDFGISRQSILALITLGASFVISIAPVDASASGYIIGNGDDGGDLEGGKPVKSGILVETRNKAVERLRRLGTANVDHLGSLLPELEKSDIYLVSREVSAKTRGDLGGGLETSHDGREVYARTFAEPHAATRFFPSALTLNEEQLIALHIHEALHRALPTRVRENEQIVTRLTLALVATDTSLDRVRSVVATEIDGSEANSVHANGPLLSSTLGEGASRGKWHLTEENQSSSLTYTYKSFFIPDRQKSNYPIDSLHSLQTMLFPFGHGRRSLGLGMEISYLFLNTPHEALLGPLNLSARGVIATGESYELALFGKLSLNTLAGEEIKNSPMGRDISTVGVTLRKDRPRYYLENSLSLSFDGEAKRKRGSEVLTYQYGKVYGASIRSGAKYKNYELGGFAELLLSESFRIQGGTGAGEATGRFRLIGLGPEFSYVRDALKLSVSARWVVDSTPGVNLDEIGDLMGTGVGQGFVSFSTTLRF